MRIVVLDGFSVDQGELRWGELTRLGDVAVHDRTAAHQVVERCAGAQAALTNKVVLGEHELRALPELRYIGVVATGTNVVDLAACRARAIAVTNVPGYASSAVAEHVFALLLHWFEDIGRYARRVKDGAWAESPDYCFFLGDRRGLEEKTLAVLGMGSIGARVAQIGRGFGMSVIATAVPGSSSAGRAPLAQALAQADVVSLHCPLTDSTRGLVDRAFLNAMKPGAVLVNTSRGGLIDESALQQALTDGRLGAALLDVLSQEPPPRDHPLLDPQAAFAGRVIVTPHVSWGTLEARSRLLREVAENLAAFLEGRRQNRID